MAIDVETFEAKVHARSLGLAVVGLGYVGLPVAATFAHAGFRVVGLERDAERVATIADGRSPIEGEEPGLAARIATEVRAGRLVATTDASALRDADVVIVCVETPVEHDHRPRYRALESAVRTVGGMVARGALVIVESTLAPGTMAGRVRGWLEEASGLVVGEQLAMGHCPERVMPGRLLANLRAMSRVCGGDAPATSRAMVALYRTIVDAELDEASCVAAEITKTAENAYRDVNIAFANELARVCEQAGADFLQVRSLVNKSPGRNVLVAGTGVGGHCIPKDPWLLAATMGESNALTLVPAARHTNDGMPRHLAALTAEALAERGVVMGEATVAVLGYAYLEDSDDERNSPSAVLVEALTSRGAKVRVHDPYVARFQGELATTLEGADAVVLAVAHKAYRALDVASLRAALRTPVLVDGRFVFEPAEARAAGLTFRGIGRGC